MSTKTITNNGVQKDAPKITTEPKFTLPVIPLKKSVDELPSLEDRFFKLDSLYALREKHEALKESLDKLNKFNLSSEGRSEAISFRDEKGNTFTTYNPEVLKKVVDWLKEDLTRKIKDVDNSIRF